VGAEKKDQELTAMMSIAAVLDGFGEEQRDTVERILRWVASRYKVTLQGPARPGNRGEEDDGAFEDFAELFHAAGPRQAPEKALVGGYWLMTGDGKGEFTGMELNTNLKNLGHGLSNVTDALTSLINRKPSFVLQTAKSGKSRQARKKYKLTRAGLDEVRRMIQGQEQSQE
jgi:hypothetical protein